MPIWTVASSSSSTTSTAIRNILNRVGNDTIHRSLTTGGFAQGSPETDFDRYVQTRQLTYVDAGFGADFGPDLHADVTVNYGMGHYKQTTDEDQFPPPRPRPPMPSPMTWPRRVCAAVLSPPTTPLS